MSRLTFKMSVAFLPLVITWLLCFLGTTWAAYYGRSVPISNVQVLTLQSGKMTTGRRSDPVPQLSCTGGCEVELDAVQCRNVGSDGRDVQWRCEADLPRHLRFAKTEVTCEGYSYPEDPNILEGSCGLEYSLKRDKSAGNAYGYEAGHGQSRDPWAREQSHPHREPHRLHTGSGFNLGQWLMYGVLAFIGYGIYKQCTAAPRQPRTFGSGFASRDTRPSAPPPPGYPHDDYSNGGPPGGVGFGGYGGGGSYGSQQAAPARGGGLGGWGGLLGGLGLGYLLGRPRGTMHGYGQPAYGGNTGGWGWGGWGRPSATTTTTTHASSPRHSSGASFSGGTHTSTAYAGTRRR